jgi:hypothetical protein
MIATEKIKDIISKLEAALSYEDWKMVEDVVEELSYLFEEMESSFPLDEWDEDSEDFK